MRESNYAWVESLSADTEKEIRGISQLKAIVDIRRWLFRYYIKVVVMVFALLLLMAVWFLAVDMENLDKAERIDIVAGFSIIAFVICGYYLPRLKRINSKEAKKAYGKLLPPVKLRPIQDSIGQNLEKAPVIGLLASLVPGILLIAKSIIGG